MGWPMRWSYRVSVASSTVDQRTSASVKIYINPDPATPTERCSSTCRLCSCVPSDHCRCLYVAHRTQTLNQHFVSDSRTMRTNRRRYNQGCTSRAAERTQELGL